MSRQATLKQAFMMTAKDVQLLFNSRVPLMNRHAASASLILENTYTEGAGQSLINYSTADGLRRRLFAPTQIVISRFDREQVAR